MSIAVKYCTIEETAAGQRLDNFLIKTLKGVPRTHIYRIIRRGDVRVNKRRATAQTKLTCGDVVRVPPTRLSQSAQVSETEITPPPKLPALPLLYEDDYLLAIDKPAGVASHGGSGVRYGAIETLRLLRPEAKFLELVHRLDRDTSGVLLIAKRRSTLTGLQAQFAARQATKTYLALVIGEYPASKKVIDLPLHKYVDDNAQRRVRIVPKEDPNGMRAITLVHVRERLQTAAGKFTLLEVGIKTGRTHQIRVHLASSGYPIAGDEKYGIFTLNKAIARRDSIGLKRMFLHAWQLRFTHPGTAQHMTLESPPPESLRLRTACLTPLYTLPAAPENIDVSTSEMIARS